MVWFVHDFVSCHPSHVVSILNEHHTHVHTLVNERMGVGGWMSVSVGGGHSVGKKTGIVITCMLAGSMLG